VGRTFANNSLFFAFALFILCSVFVLNIFSEYEFHSIGSDTIVFRRRIPLPYILQKLAWFFDILSFLLLGDKYLVIKAIEITRLPREIIRRAQRPIILQENFQSTGIRKY